MHFTGASFKCGTPNSQRYFWYLNILINNVEVSFFFKRLICVELGSFPSLLRCSETTIENDQNFMLNMNISFHTWSENAFNDTIVNWKWHFLRNLVHFFLADIL